jgi:hypothetical protein
VSNIYDLINQLDLLEEKVNRILGKFKKPGGVIVIEAQYLENPASDAIPRWEREWGVNELRFVAIPETQTLYIFPNWLLHSDFLQKHLNLSYEDVMDSTDIFFGIIRIVKGGSPYAVTESSQFETLLGNLMQQQHTGSLKKVFKILNDQYGWMRSYGIEPIEALARDYAGVS